MRKIAYVIVDIGDALFTAQEAQLIPANAKVKEVEAQLSSATANINQAKETLARAENHLRIGEALVPGSQKNTDGFAVSLVEIRVDQSEIVNSAI